MMGVFTQTQPVQGGQNSPGCVQASHPLRDDCGADTRCEGLLGDLSPLKKTQQNNGDD